MPQKLYRTRETSTRSSHKRQSTERRRTRLKILKASALLLMTAALLLPLMHSRTALADGKTKLQALMQRRRVRTGAARPASPRPAKALALAAAGGCATPFTEAPNSPFTAGDGPTSIAVADFNKDGKPDMASANSFSDDVTILLGNGAGSFSEAASSPITVGSGPASVAAGDFNNDGNPDLAVVNVVDGDVTILLGNGSGGFTEATGSPVDVGESPLSVAVGDFNNDGKQDLATANFDDGDVTILLGDGAGKFAAATGSPVTVGSDPGAVAVADFNDDGKADLATANNGSDDVTILIGDGSGGFTATATSPTAGSSPASVAAGDFNNDGKPDLAVGNDNSGDVTILLGDGLGGFTEPAGSPVFTGFGAAASVLDFNNDGNEDLAASSLAFNDVTILIGDGAGGFTESAGSPVAGHEGPFMVAVGDFNNDGRQDLATPNADCTDVTVLLNTCEPNCAATQFAQLTDSIVPGSDYNPIVATDDFNNDGKLDLVVPLQNDGPNNDRVLTLLGDGTGGFTPAGPPTPVTETPIFMAVADLNTDGNQDLAITHYSGDRVTILLGDGAGGFSQPAGSPIVVSSFPGRIAAGDFNNDGKPDLATANTGSDNVTILMGDGAGGFTQTANSPIAVGHRPLVVVIEDFNNDGKADLVVTKGSLPAKVTTLLGDGTGDFTEAPGSPVTVDEEPYSAAVADFNHDGNLDLGVANFGNFNVTILMGDGAGGFTKSADSPLPTLGESPVSIQAGDFNNDGHPDLATAIVSGSPVGKVLIFVGDGAGGFSQGMGSPVAVPTGPGELITGDFNNDGRPDLAVASQTVDNLTILINACSIDLSISKLDTPDPVLPGDKITYNLTVTNKSAKTAASVVVTDKLAATTTYVSATPSQGTCSGTTLITCNLGSIAGGDSATIKIVAQTTAPGVVSNSAIVNGTPDPDRSNNGAYVTTKVIGLQSLSISPALLTGGCWNSRYNGTVTLTAPAPPGGVLVKLSDDAAEVSSPVSVRVEKGQTTATFTGAAGTVTSVREVMFTATALGTTVKKKLTVQPVRITSLSLAPSTVKGGNPVTGSLSLTCAPTSDVRVTLTSGRWAAWLPARQITIPAGHATGKFTVNTLAVGSPVDALITATANGAAKSATLHIVP